MKPDRFTQMVLKEYGVGSPSAVKLLRREHAAVVRLVKKLRSLMLFQAQRLTANPTKETDDGQ